MATFLIHPQAGILDLPNGLTITPSLTQDEFLFNPAFSQAKHQTPASGAWSRHPIPAGTVDGHDLLAILCFHDQRLVNIDLIANLYPPIPKDQHQYSLDIEAAIKQLHDRLLEQMFGPPTERLRIFPNPLPPSQSILEWPLRWDFPWGQVFSSHDFNGGGTSIIIRYSDRTDQPLVNHPASD